MYEGVLKEKEGVTDRLAAVEGEVRRVKAQLATEQTTSAAAAKVREGGIMAEGRGEGGGGELEDVMIRAVLLMNISVIFCISVFFSIPLLFLCILLYSSVFFCIHLYSSVFLCIL